MNKTTVTEYVQEVTFLQLLNYIKSNVGKLPECVTDDVIFRDLEYRYQHKLAACFVTQKGDLGGFISVYPVSPTMIHVSEIIVTKPEAMLYLLDWLESKFEFASLRAYRKHGSKLCYYPDAHEFLKKLKRASSFQRQLNNQT